MQDSCTTNPALLNQLLYSTSSQTTYTSADTKGLHIAVFLYSIVCDVFVCTITIIKVKCLISSSTGSWQPVFFVNKAH